MQDDQYEDWTEDLAAASGIFNAIALTVGAVLAVIATISFAAWVFA